MPDTDALDRTAQRAALIDWIIAQGVYGTSFEALIEGISLRLVDMGIALQRVHTTFRALHPVYGAFAYRWKRETGKETEIFTSGNMDYPSSPLFHMLANDLDEMRHRLKDGTGFEAMPLLVDLRQKGGTDYLAARMPFVDPEGVGPVDPYDPPEGMMMSFVTDAPNGFAPRDIEDLRAIIPPLALTLKSGSSRRMMRDMLEVYLGPDASARVISGEITRGSTEDISAVILLFDLSGFTRLSEALSGAAVIEMLNSYFEMVVEQVEKRGGNVLKFMGDGLLAVFTDADETVAGKAALEAVKAIRTGMDRVSLEREAYGRPVTGCTMAVHAGQVMYGNIGADSRLDFTVIGPAVNTTARLSGMCAHVDQTVVISARVARPHLGQYPELVSLGQYRMRGVAERHELFTLERDGGPEET